MQRRHITLLSEWDIREFSPPPQHALGAPFEPEPDNEQRAAKRRRLTLIANNYIQGEPPIILTALLKGPFDTAVTAQTRSYTSSPSQSPSRAKSKKWINPWRARTAQHPGVGPAKAAELRSQHIQNREKKQEKDSERRIARRKRLNRAADLRQDGLGISTTTPVDLTVDDSIQDAERGVQDPDHAAKGAEPQTEWLSRRQSTKLSFDNGHDISQESSFVRSPLETLKTQPERLRSQDERRKHPRTGHKDDKVQTSIVAPIKKLKASPTGVKPIPRPSNTGARILGRHSDGVTLSSKDTSTFTFHKAATTGRKKDLLEARAVHDPNQNRVPKRGRKNPRRMMFDTPVLHKRPELEVRALVADVRQAKEATAFSRHIAVPGRAAPDIGRGKNFDTIATRELAAPVANAASHPISSPAKLQDPLPPDPSMASAEVQVPSTAPQSTLPHRPTPSDDVSGRASRSNVQQAQELDLIKISNDLDTQAIATGVDDAFDDLFDVTEPDVQLPAELAAVPTVPQPELPHKGVSGPPTAITPFKDYHLRDLVSPNNLLTASGSRAPLDTQAILDALSPFAQSTVKKPKPQPKRVTLSEIPVNTPDPSLTIKGTPAAEPISDAKSQSRDATGDNPAENPLQHAHHQSFSDFTPLNSHSSDDANSRSSSPMSFASPRTRARRMTFGEGQELLNRNSFSLEQGADVVGSFLKSWQMDATPTSLPRTSQQIPSVHSGWRPINTPRSIMTWDRFGNV